jgi:hypothetical protein
MDRRPLIPEPPPVRLLAVEDVVIEAPAGTERELDALYVEVLKFERLDDTRPARPAVQPILGGDVPHVPVASADRPLPPLSVGAQRGPVYKAEKNRLCVEVREPPIAREDLRPVKLDVPSLAAITAELDRREFPYIRQRGLLPGDRAVLLQDAAGNWIEVTESRPI